MADKDILTKEFFSDPLPFADVINGVLFSGRQVIGPEEVKELDSRISFGSSKIGKNNNLSVIRDVVREVTIPSDATGMSLPDDSVHTAIVALEHQSDVHFAMPVRILCGDALYYNKQYKLLQKTHKEKKDLKKDEYLSGISQNDKLKPVYSITIYTGSKPWNGPRCLGDMLDSYGIPMEMQGYSAEQPMLFLDLRHFPDYDCFRSDLKWICGFLQHDHDPDVLAAYIAENEFYFSNISTDAAELITLYSNSADLLPQLNDNMPKGGTTNMCRAIDEMKARSRAEGKAEERIQSIRNAILLCLDNGIPKMAAINSLMKRYALSNEEAVAYTEQYWENCVLS